MKVFDFRIKNWLASMCAMLFGFSVRAAPADIFDLAKDGVAVRIADLTIDPAQLEAFQAAVKEEMDDAVRLEPGVISIYAIAIKGRPNQIRFVEIYANERAYATHRETPHFQKYLKTTKSMITARELYEGIPVKLAGKKK